MLLSTTRARAGRRPAWSARIASALFPSLAVLGVAAPPAEGAERTYHDLTTGNGLGFQLFSTEQQKITQFLEHPYRYLKPREGEPQADGVSRRNLAFDVYFGVRGGGDHGWLNEPSSAGEAGYLDQTHIIKAPVTLGGIDAESYFFSPFGAEAMGNVMIALLEAPAASDGYLLLNFHMGNGEGDTVGANGESIAPIAGTDALTETGPGGGAMVYVPLSGVAHADCQGAFDKVKQGQDLADNDSCSGDDIALGLQAQLTDGWMAVAVAFVENASDASSRANEITTWAAARAPEKILEDALAEFEAWRKPPPAELALCSDNEKALWRQSEAILRMGQTREPYTSTRKNHGMMLASLPRGMWHSGWVRDAAYGLVAFARTGHYDEARIGLDFYLNAGPVGKFKEYVSNQDYRISVVRYFGNGEEEADYSGQPTPNVEIDGWGMTLWVARQYVSASADTAWLSSKTKAGETVYDVLKTGVADPLENNLETTGIAKADSGIWEVHDANKRHFAYTTLATIRGFCDMAALAKAAGRTDDVAKYQELSAKAKAGFLSSFVDTNGALAGSLEGLQINKYYDGAVAEAFTWNILDDFAGDTASSTLEMLNNLRVESGGWKRNNDGLSSYDNNEWILVDFRILNALRRAGRGDEADPYLATIIEKAAANFFLLPELYNAVAADGAVGKYWGEVPMVGYGAGAYMMTMLDRSGLIEPNDCGDDMGKTLETLSCEGVDTTPGIGTGSGGPGGEDGPASFDDIPYGQSACICAVPGRASPTRTGGALALLLAVPSLLALRRRQRRA